MRSDLKGRRVEAVVVEDGKSVPRGTQGTVAFVDDIGTIHVSWDNGSTLGVIPGVDKYKIIE